MTSGTFIGSLLGSMDTRRRFAEERKILVAGKWLMRIKVVGTHRFPENSSLREQTVSLKSDISRKEEQVKVLENKVRDRQSFGESSKTFSSSIEPNMNWEYSQSDSLSQKSANHKLRPS